MMPLEASWNSEGKGKRKDALDWNSKGMGFFQTVSNGNDSEMFY